MVLLIACQQKSSDIEQDIPTLDLKKLEDLEEKKAFLQEIFNADQLVRTEYHKIELKYGRDSDQFYTIVNKMDSIDNSGLAKTNWYLDNYDYPDKATYGDNLSILPALVVI